MTEVVLVGVDGSSSGDRAADFAVERAAARGTTVLVAHVVPWSPFTLSSGADNAARSAQREDELREATDRIVTPVVERARAAGVPVESVVRHGHPAQTLCDLAVEHEVRHVVIGRVGESRLRALLFGSVPASLVQISPVPVTVVP